MSRNPDARLYIRPNSKSERLRAQEKYEKIVHELDLDKNV